MSIWDLIEFGAQFDLVNPAIGLTQEIAHGGGDQIFFHRSVSVNEAERGLEAAGIQH